MSRPTRGEVEMAHALLLRAAATWRRPRNPHGMRFERDLGATPSVGFYLPMIPEDRDAIRGT